MTKALVTVRNGATLTAIHDAALAAAWIRELSATLLTNPLQDRMFSLHMATWTDEVAEEVLPMEISLSTATMLKALTRALTRAISLSMSLKRTALARTSAEEEVPKQAVLNVKEKVESL